MKNLVLVAVAGAFVLGANTASAQTFGDTATFNLKATVSEVCGVAAFAGLESTIDFSDLADDLTTETVEGVKNTNGGSLSYICNAPAGFTRKISSQNKGYLFREGTSGGDNNRISYTMSHGGGSGLGPFSGLQLTSDAIEEFNGSGAFLEGQTGSVSFEINGVLETGVENRNQGNRTTVFAGDYFDVVTISVAAR